jgi:hypothetical protein
VLERGLLDDQAVARLLPTAVKLDDLPVDAPFVRALAVAIRALPDRSGSADDVLTAVGEDLLPRVLGRK